MLRVRRAGILQLDTSGLGHSPFDCTKCLIAELSARRVRTIYQPADGLQLSERRKFRRDTWCPFDKNYPSYRHAAAVSVAPGIQVAHPFPVGSLVHNAIFEVRTEFLDHGPRARFKRRR